MKRSLIIVLALSTALLSGCIKPYNAPKFIDISNNETAYVIPLQGDTSQQGKFVSSAFLEQHKVAAKRIQIPREWVSTGRFADDGYYQDQVRIITVERSPVTVEFHQDKAGQKDADAIWIESRDSIGFSTGFSVTALIKEEDASTFLYRYSALSLKQVLTGEIRARIQQVAAQFAAQYNLDELRSKKNEMLAEIRKDIIPFFADRGITLTTVGQFSGMTYDTESIQSSIDATFVAQQQKVVAAALLTAQKDINEKSEQEFQQKRRNAILIAEGEAQAIKLVADAAAAAQSSPSFLRLKELEVEVKRIDKWNGTTPQTLIEGGSTGLSMFLNPQAK